MREIIGNYNHKQVKSAKMRNYTLERDNRELQRFSEQVKRIRHYTLERDNRELQPNAKERNGVKHYTLERDNRELQHILDTY